MWDEKSAKRTIMAKLLVLLAAFFLAAANAKIFVFKADQCNVRVRVRHRPRPLACARGKLLQLL